MGTIFFKATIPQLPIYAFKMSISVGAGEMAQWSKALAALPEDLGLIPSSHMNDYVYL